MKYHPQVGHRIRTGWGLEGVWTVEYMADDGYGFARRSDGAYHVVRPPVTYERVVDRPTIHRSERWVPVDKDGKFIGVGVTRKDICEDYPGSIGVARLVWDGHVEWADES